MPLDFRIEDIQNGSASLTVLTGAGIDAEAGLPTFRGEKGYYEDKESAYFASVEAMNNEPIRQWRWYLKRFVTYYSTSPSSSHAFLAKLEKRLGEKFLGVVTQNISGLHRKAGNKKIFEIHGCISQMRNLITGECKSIPEAWINSAPSSEELVCWRPNVCFIGENYNNYPLTEGLSACENCEILLVIGTAGVIHTPVWLAEKAKLSGSVVVNINPNQGELDKISDITFRERASEYLK